MPSNYLPIHPSMRDPRTGEPLRAIYRTRHGRFVYPVMGGSQPAGEPPAQPAPAPVAPPAPAPSPPQQPAPTVPPPTPAASQPAPATGADPDSFPANTPVAEMTVQQQAAYWKHYARRNEQRLRDQSDYDSLKETAANYQRLVAASQTEHERAVADARQQGRTEALAEAGGRLVEAHVRAAAIGRLDTERVNTLLEGLDRGKFLSSNGEVDADKVSNFIATFAPAPVAVQPPAETPPATPAQPVGQPGTAPAATRAPDMGQGTFSSAPPNGLEAGRAAARARYGAKQPA